jgi:hypothetical protein
LRAYFQFSSYNKNHVGSPTSGIIRVEFWEQPDHSSIYITQKTHYLDAFNYLVLKGHAAAISKDMQQPFHGVSFQTFCCLAWVLATLRKRLERDAGIGRANRRTEVTWKKKVQMGR